MQLGYTACTSVCKDSPTAFSFSLCVWEGGGGAVKLDSSEDAYNFSMIGNNFQVLLKTVTFYRYFGRVITDRELAGDWKLDFLVAFFQNLAVQLYFS